MNDRRVGYEYEDVRERIEEALLGDIRDLAVWIDTHRPWIGNWRGPEQVVLDTASARRALRQFVQGAASKRDLKAWASFLIFGGPTGPAPLGEHLMTVPVEYHVPASEVLRALVSDIDMSDQTPDRFGEKEASEYLKLLATFDQQT